MLETWKQTFLSEGTVEVRMGVPRALVVLAAGLAFLAVGYWMATASPTDGVLADLGSTGRLVVGLLSLALGLVGVLGGVRSLIRPLLVVRLDRTGVHVPGNAPIPWERIEGAEAVSVAGQTMPAVRTSADHGREAANQGGAKGALAAANAGIVGEDKVALRPGAAGGDQAVVEPIDWARDQMRGGDAADPR